MLDYLRLVAREDRTPAPRQKVDEVVSVAAVAACGVVRLSRDPLLDQLFLASIVVFCHDYFYNHSVN